MFADISDTSFLYCIVFYYIIFYALFQAFLRFLSKQRVGSGSCSLSVRFYTFQFTDDRADIISDAVAAVRYIIKQLVEVFLKVLR